MGKKKRGHPDVEELLSRPWCFYCERDFEDLKLLISHQKAKHFKCDRCGKRLNTAGGLSVHMNQVHKESLNGVENALPNRQGLDIEIFGMEGIPEDILQQHNQRIVQNFYTAQAERHAATGNPPPGQNRGQGPTKKVKMETPEEIKKRLAEHRARLAAAQQPAAANGGAGGTTKAPADGRSPGQSASPFLPPQPGHPYPPPATTSGPPSFSPPPGYPPAYPPGGLPARPPGGGAPPAPAALPQRPPYGAPGAAPSSVDELVAAGGGAAKQGDDIDNLIRMAEAGIRPAGEAGASSAAAAAPPAAAEKRSKRDKDKNMRMVYGDSEVSPEERLARMPRYAFVPSAA